MTARWSTFDLVIHRRSYPSGNQPFIPQPRKAASAPRLRYFDGNVKNLFTGDNVNGSENIVVRGKLVWKPTSTLDVDVNLTYAKMDSDPTYVYKVLSPNARLRGNASQTPAVIMPSITPGPENLQVTLNEQPYFNSTDFAKSVRMSWTLPNDLTLVSISAHDSYESLDHIDSDRTVSPIISNFADGHFTGDTFTQEVRLVSPGNRPLVYTLGLFYADTDLRREIAKCEAASVRSRALARLISGDCPERSFSACLDSGN